MINCPNPECQTVNPEGSRTCSSCQTCIPHRYLWVAGAGKLDRLDKRYSRKQQRVVLDTQPGLPPPESPDPMPSFVMPYLMLAPHSLHVPQPYAFMPHGQGEGLLLLDRAPLAVASSVPKLLPSLQAAWPDASPLRQLNWLWQIAKLWPDFLSQRVAGSLLLGEPLRVDGSTVRLLELNVDARPPSLADLGAAWLSLVASSHPSLHVFLEDLCHRLTGSEIATPALLCASLNQAIADAAQGYHSNHELAVVTHQGPSRKRNEDACYPASGSTQRHILEPGTGQSASQRPLLLLVCDGIGGHEGGDIASRLAISTIQQQLAPLLDLLTKQPVHNPARVATTIKQAIAVANDQISEHNDQALRQARNRMGTTLVMALIVGVHVYIAHVGDSRAYYISGDSCQQITFDDDVAAREVRLGYGFYADVVNRPGTGALIQALGMGGSAALHINVQHLVLEGDAVLLLCSDGLSDYERVDQFWDIHLRPVLLGKTATMAAVNDLLQLANTYNGHDNVTIGVVAGRSKNVNPAQVPLVSLEAAAATLPPVTEPTPVAAISPPVTTIAPEVPVVRKNRFWVFLWAFSLLAAVATVATMVFFRGNAIVSSTEPAPPLPASIQDKIDNQNNQSVGISDDESNPPSLTPGSYLRLVQPLALVASLQPTGTELAQLGQLPQGGIIQVLTQQELAGEEARWIKVKVCGVERGEPLNRSTPNLESDSSESGPSTVGVTDVDVTDANAKVTETTPASLTSGTEGWVLEAELAASARGAVPSDCPPG
ncbi:MAG: protein phosphatase 2C domain-containing protein [Cyanobacteria bacterium J06642_11]